MGSFLTGELLVDGSRAEAGETCRSAPTGGGEPAGGDSDEGGVVEASELAICSSASRSSRWRAAGSLVSSAACS